MKSTLHLIIASAIVCTATISCQQTLPLLLNETILEAGIGTLNEEIVCPLCGETISPYEIDINGDGVYSLSETERITALVYNGDSVIDIDHDMFEYFPNIEHIIMKNISPYIVSLRWSIFPDIEGSHIKCVNIKLPDSKNRLPYDGSRAQFEYPTRFHKLPRINPNIEYLSIDLGLGSYLFAQSIEECIDSLPNLKKLRLKHDFPGNFIRSEATIWNLSIDLPFLEEFQCGLQECDTIDLSKTPNLKKLDCSCITGLSYINLKNNTKLQYIDLSNVVLLDNKNIIDFSYCTDLEYLDLHFNPEELCEELYCSPEILNNWSILDYYNNIWIDVTKNRKLKYLNFSGRNSGHEIDQQLILDLSNNLLLEEVVIPSDSYTAELPIKVIISNTQLNKEWVKKYENDERIEFEVI